MVLKGVLTGQVYGEYFKVSQLYAHYAHFNAALSAIQRAVSARLDYKILIYIKWLMLFCVC
jgi:hypothetical protein